VELFDETMTEEAINGDVLERIPSCIVPKLDGILVG
jgi:hypothetical protein